MAEDITLGNLGIDVVANTTTFERQVTEDLRRRAEEAGRKAGDAIGRGMARNKRAPQQAAIATVDEVVRGLQRAADRKMADAREELFRKLIDRAEFERRGREAGEAFNRGILEEIERRAEAGRLRTDDFIALTNQLKDVGEAAEDAGRKTGSAFRGIRGVVAGVIAVIASSKLVRWLRDAASAALDLQRSFLRLQATSRLFGADQREMIALAQHGRRELRLSGAVANELAASTASFAAQAGQAAKAQELLTRALDLGAAQGERAANVALVLDQTLRGQSEGLQRLLQRNPSQIYAAYAESIGKAASALTEAERKQATMNAIIEAGRRVQGEYSRQLETDLGTLDSWSSLLETIRERIGSGLIPILARLASTLEGPLTRAANAAERALRAMNQALESDAEREIRVLRELGLEEMALARQREELIARAERRREEAAERARSAASRAAGVIPGGERPTARQLEAGITEAAQRRAREEADRLLSDPLYFLQQWHEVEQKVRDVEAGRLELTAAQLEALNRRRQALQEITDALEAQERLDRELLNLARARTTLPDTEDDAPPGMTKEQLKLMEQLTDDVARLTETATETALRELGKLEDEFRMTFGGSIPAAAAEGLAKIRENIELGGVLDGFRQEFQEIAEMRPSPEALAAMQVFVARLREQRDAIDESHVRWKEFDALVQEVEKRARAGTAEALIAPYRAAFDQQMAELREQLARGIIDRKEFERAGREAGKTLRDAILAEIEKLRASGALSDEVYQALVGALPGEADPSRDDAERLRNLRDQARAIEEGARAGIQLADAFGLVDSRSAAVLQNVAQIGASIARIAGGDLTAIPGAIAGAASLISSIVGDGATASRERVRQIEEMVRLREALEKLRHAVLTDVTAAERERMVSGGAGILGAGRGRPWWRMLNADAQLRTAAQMTGMSKEDVLALIREIESATGATIWSERGIDLDALEKALERLPELGLFTDDLMGQLDAFDWLLSTLGDDAGTAAEQVERFLAVLRSAGAEGFADEFQRILDEQGAEAAHAWLNSLAEGVAARDQSLFGVGGIFEGLTAEQARRLIERSGGLLSGSGLVASGRPETRMAVNLTQTQGDELLRIGSTQLYHLAGIHSLIAQMVSAPPPSFGAIPDISPPSPASLGLGGPTMIEVGGITVQLALTAAESVTPGNAHDVGERIGAGIGAGMSDRLRSAYRGSGASGPARVRVDTRIT